jgi:hypothetical protein
MEAYLHNLPSTSNLVIQLPFQAREHGSVRTLFNFIVRSDNDFSRLHVPECQYFLCCEGDVEDGKVVFEDLPHVNLGGTVNTADFIAFRVDE